ncbi:MAG: hypothetical protein ACNA8K_12620 [Cyclonatronaceae bacterium]
MTINFKTIALVAASAILFIACASEEPETDIIDLNDVVAAETARDQFLTNLAAHCGNAYAGSLTLAPPGDTMLEGDELLVVHFRECSDSELRLPFHIRNMDGTWNRSRTWIFTRHDGRIELRHDHRKPDGSEDEVTMYGGSAIDEGTPNLQVFQSVPRTGETGIFRGWRLEIEPHVRYTYGTVRGDEWSWRIDFDLSNPIEAPPAPWGHD